MKKIPHIKNIAIYSAFMLTASSSQAYVVADPTLSLDTVDENDTMEAPLGDSSFPVANIGFGTTYLGNGWCVRANHAGSLHLVRRNPDGTTDQINGDFNNGRRFFRATTNELLTVAEATNSSGNISGIRDLMLVRLKQDPRLPEMEVASGTLSGKDVLLYSHNHYLNSYHPGASNLFRTTSSLGNTAKRWNWGTNIIEPPAPNISANLFKTVMDAPGSGDTIYEAQAIGGDSSSGAYTKENGEWKIAGIAVSAFNSTGFYNYGNFTLFENLQTVKGHIDNLIANSPPVPLGPEIPQAPASTGLKRDFDGDGNNDFLWRNVTDGRTVIHFMDDTTSVSSSYTTQTVGLFWKIVGVGDFDGDSKADILWRNINDGRTAIHFMDGATMIGGGMTTQTVGMNWEVAGAGDFNSDGKADIVWRALSGARTVVQYMDGLNFISAEDTSHKVGQLWNIGGIGDFDGDGKTDIAWRRVSGVVTAIHYMDGVNLLNAEHTDFPVGNKWEMVGADDMNGDEKADILWRRISNGSTLLHHMNGSSYVDGAYTDPQITNGWNLFLR